MLAYSFGWACKQLEGPRHKGARQDRKMHGHMLEETVAARAGDAVALPEWVDNLLYEMITKSVKKQ